MLHGARAGTQGLYDGEVDAALERLAATPLARDPEKWEPVFGKDHAQNKNLERDDDSKKNHPALEHDPEKWIPVFGKDHAPAMS
jgi:predicted cobalt transporter CbtA